MTARYSGHRCRPRRVGDSPASKHRTMAGMIHTRWWIHVTGLIRHPRSPVRARAPWSSPAADAWRTRYTQYARTSRTSRSHTYDVAWPRSRRASSPRSDWLEVIHSLPTRLVCHSATVQYTRDGPGATTAANAVAATSVPVAVAAARQRRVTI